MISKRRCDSGPYRVALSFGSETEWWKKKLSNMELNCEIMVLIKEFYRISTELSTFFNLKFAILTRIFGCKILYEMKNI